MTMRTHAHTRMYANAKCLPSNASVASACMHKHLHTLERSGRNTHADVKGTQSGTPICLFTFPSPQVLRSLQGAPIFHTSTKLTSSCAPLPFPPFPLSLLPSARLATPSTLTVTTHIVRNFSFNSTPCSPKVLEDERKGRDSRCHQEVARLRVSAI